MSQVLEGFTTVFLVEHFVTASPILKKKLDLSQELNQTLLKLVEKSNEECTNLRFLLNDIIQNGLTKSENIQKTTETNTQTKTVDSVKQLLNPMAEFTENLRTGSRIAAVPQLTETQPVNLTSSQPTAKPNRTVSPQTAKQHSSCCETSNKKPASLTFFNQTFIL